MKRHSAVLSILLMGACGDDAAPAQDAGVDGPELMTIDDYCPGQAHCTGSGGDGLLSVGVDKQPIMPTLVETEWDDANGNHKWEQTESFTDVNGNGRFDAFW